MGQINFKEVNQDDVKRIQKKVESHSTVLEEIVNGIIEPYCKDLDKYV